MSKIQETGDCLNFENPKIQAKNRDWSKFKILRTETGRYSVLPELFSQKPPLFWQKKPLFRHHQPILVKNRHFLVKTLEPQLVKFLKAKNQKETPLEPQLVIFKKP